MLFLFLLIFTTLAYAHAYGGYDSGGGAPGTCGRPYRAGRMHTPSCNLDEGFCRQAGDSYPWKAMRRFVRENQGLMRRMYGDQAEGSVLRGEFGRKMKFASPDLHKYSRRQEKDMENELYLNEEEEFEELLSEARYLKDADHRFESRYLRDEDVLNTKFVYSEEPTLSIKLAGLKTAAHFRPTTSSTSTTTETSTTSTTEDKNETVAATTDNNLVINDEDSENTTTASLREVEGDLPLPNDEEVGNSTASIMANKTILSTVINDILTTTSTTNINDRIDLESNTSDIKETVQISFQDEISLNDEATTLPSTKSDDNAQNSEKPNEYNKQPSEAPSGDTMLFQDMDSEEKVKVNYKLVGVNACPVKEEVVAPFWANNTRGEVLALLNMYPFEQYVHWEKCTFEHKQMYCRDGCRCEQQYRLHRLLAYDPNNECRGIFSDWFRFPSCCVCKCYGLPPEFRVTSRSPRNRDHWESDRNEN